MKSTRREVLRTAGALGAGLWLGGKAARAAQVPRAQLAPDGGAQLAPDAFDELVRRVREAERDGACALVQDFARGGGSPFALLDAVFAAGVQDIRPRHVGGKLHAVMMVPSAVQLAAEASPRSAWLAALWNLDDFKRSQELDLAEGDWSLPARPAAPSSSVAAARRELEGALGAWDDERADRALAALVASAGPAARAELLEVLWPFALASFVDLGHKVIYAAQVARALETQPEHAVEPALRSLVCALLHGRARPQTEVFEGALERASELAPTWRQGREEPAESEALARALRGASASAAQDAVVLALAGGLGPHTAWDALRLRAGELFLSRARSEPAEDPRALLPVHAVTVVEACGHVARHAASDRTQRAALLTAAGRLAELERELEQRGCLAAEPSDLLALGAGEEPAELAALFAEAAPGAVCAALERSPEDLAAYRSRLAEAHFLGAREHHQPKCAAALLAEGARVHPRFAARLLATGVAYLPTSLEPATELAARALRALDEAGVAPAQRRSKNQ